jgi:hypothetical protein
MEIEESICFQVPRRDHEECVQMLRGLVHKEREHDEDYDADAIDGFLDRVIADPAAFLSILSLKLTAARKAQWERVRAQAIEEKGLSEPVREIVEYDGKDETRVRLIGNNGKSVLIHLTLETLQ